MTRSAIAYPLAALLAATACSNHDNATTAPVIPSFASLPCLTTGTLTLGSAQSALVDCSNGGTTVTLAGNGASYLVVAQICREPRRGQLGSVSRQLGKRRICSAGATRLWRVGVAGGRAETLDAGGRRSRGGATGRETASVRWNAAGSRTTESDVGDMESEPVTRTGGGISFGESKFRCGASGRQLRPFTVLANNEGTAFTRVGGRLAYAGSSVLVYLDTLAAANGFTTAQLQAFGQLFDQTLYPIDTAAFGPPSDIDGNGRVIMLMTPAVNALTPAAECQTQGFVAGFFEEEDLGGGSSDPNSNDGEIFYSMAPDPSGVSSCAHSVADVGADVPSTFMHELQHLISYSQHAVIHGGQPEYGWLDEGLSIVAEELGSLFYERNARAPHAGRARRRSFRIRRRASCRIFSTTPTNTRFFRTRRVSHCTTTPTTGSPGAAATGSSCAGLAISSGLRYL